MRDLDSLFPALAKSTFRRKFHLSKRDFAYATQNGLPTLLTHARKIIAQRLAPTHPANDGKQTPLRNHPVFVAQHATATCCRGCLAKWHHIPKGHALTPEEQSHCVAAIERWLRNQGIDQPTQGQLF
jgi:hypothetical protein